MDRELVFAVLVPALCGAMLMAAGWWWPLGAPRCADINDSEPRMWWRIWLPFAPAAFVFAMLCGWALEEPANAEPVPKAIMLAALPFIFIFVRATWRATRSLELSWEISKAQYTIATVGLFRPRIIVSPAFADALDKDALNAAMEHERAHARHRDPLRLWLAQLGTELQWPTPASVARLKSWKRALEIARDDEARMRGTAGPDLAAAILASIRLSQVVLADAAARLTDETFVKERVMRLLQPLKVEAAPQRRITPIMVLLSLAIPVAILFGIKFGERLIGSLLTDA